MLSKVFLDIWWTFGIPTICLVSFLTNLTSYIVFKRINKQPSQAIIYKYIEIKSLSVCFYLFSCSCVFMVKCGHLCPTIMSTPTFNLISKIYELYLFRYATACLGLFDLLIEAVIGLERLFVVMNKKYLKHVKIQLSIIFAISIVFYSPELFLFGVNTNSSSTKYHIILRYSDTMAIYHSFLLFTAVLRGLILVILLICINMIGCLIFRRRMMAKRTLKKTGKGNK